MLQNTPIQQTTDIPPGWHLIGKGGFGKVYKGVKNGQVKAFKIINNKDDAVKEFSNTVTVSGHHHVVKIYNAQLLNQSTLCIEMDYYENGSLHDYFIRQHKKIPSANMIKSIMTQVLDALVYMKEKLKMVHRDIKPGNILIRNIDLENDSIDVCLADFGMAKNTPGLSENSTLSYPKGTEGYIAPELYRPVSEQRYTLASDIFALGATLFKIMTRISLNEFPYYEWSKEPKLTEMIYKMLKINSTTPDELIQTISNMFITDTDKRVESVMKLFPQFQEEEEEPTLPQPMNPPQYTNHVNNIPIVIQQVKPSVLTGGPKKIKKPNKTSQLLPKSSPMLNSTLMVHKIVQQDPTKKQQRRKPSETNDIIEEIVKIMKGKEPSFMLSDNCIRKIFFLPIKKNELETFSKILEQNKTSLDEEEFKIMLKFIIEDEIEIQKCINNYEIIRNWMVNEHSNPSPEMNGISTNTLTSIQHLLKNKEEYRENVNSLIELLQGKASKEKRLYNLCPYNINQIKSLIGELREISKGELTQSIVDKVQKEKDPECLARKLMCFCLNYNITSEQEKNNLNKP